MKAKILKVKNICEELCQNNKWNKKQMLKNWEIQFILMTDNIISYFDSVYCVIFCNFKVCMAFWLTFIVHFLIKWFKFFSREPEQLLFWKNRFVWKYFMENLVDFLLYQNIWNWWNWKKFWSIMKWDKGLKYVKMNDLFWLHIFSQSSSKFLR